MAQNNTTPETVETKRHSQAYDVWRRFRRNKLALVGMGIAIFLILVAVFANVIAPYDPVAISTDRMVMPCAKHLFGTDNMGRDLFTRCVYGARVSLLVSLMATIFSLIIGIGLGATAGYFGGRYESVVMRVCDIMMCIPGMLLSVCISCILGIGLVNTAIAIAVAGVAPSIRMIRATVMSVRSQEFVEAAKATGSGNLKIVLHEIMPNSLSQIIVDCTMRIGGNILQISGLSFIGLGVQPPTSEWGSIMSAGQQYITTYWPMITFPGICILLTVFAFNVMGDGLRDALDPRLKQ